jgi:hypothetical protein
MLPTSPALGTEADVHEAIVLMRLNNERYCPPPR